MKIEHGISHIPILTTKTEQLATWIQPLFKELWQDNSVSNIQRKLKQYPNAWLSLIESKQEILGFGIYHIVQIEKQKVLFRNGAVINPKYQQQGLYNNLVQATYDEHKEQIDLYVVRTREIAVYKAIYKLHQYIEASIIYPNLLEKKQKRIPSDTLKVMRHFSGKESISKTGVVKNVYPLSKTSSLTSLIPLGDRDALMIAIEKAQ